MILPVCAAMQNSQLGCSSQKKPHLSSNQNLRTKQMPYDQVSFGDKYSAAKKAAEEASKAASEKLKNTANKAKEVFEDDPPGKDPLLDLIDFFNYNL